MELPREFHTPSVGFAPGMVGKEACESFFPHPFEKTGDHWEASGAPFPLYPEFVSVERTSQIFLTSET